MMSNIEPVVPSNISEYNHQYYRKAQEALRKNLDRELGKRQNLIAAKNKQRERLSQEIRKEKRSINKLRQFVENISRGLYNPRVHIKALKLKEKSRGLSEKEHMLLNKLEARIEKKDSARKKANGEQLARSAGFMMSEAEKAIADPDYFNSPEAARLDRQFEKGKQLAIALHEHTNNTSKLAA